MESTTTTRDRLLGYLLRLAWAVLWRFAFLGGAIAVEESGYRPPLLLVAEFAGFAGVGALLGLSRTGSRLAAIWRMVTVAVLVAFLGPAAPPVYPSLLVVALALATLEPFLAASRRRAVLDRPLVPVAASPANGGVAPVEPPRARARHARGLMTGVACTALLGGAAGAGYAIYSNPAPASHAAQAVQQAGQQAADWVRGVLGGSSTSPAAPAPAAPGALTVAPHDQVPTSRWAPADCSWATATLSYDTQLDVAEAQAVAAGGDARYGTGPNLVAYYQQYGAEWTKVNAEVAAACSEHTAPSRDQAADALAWFYRATQAHRADTAANPGDADWNNRWIANYARLSALFGDVQA